jgi:hypothetical protein
VKILKLALIAACIPTATLAGLNDVKFVGVCMRENHPNANVTLVINEFAHSGTFGAQTQRPVSALQLIPTSANDTNIKFDAPDLTGALIRHFDGGYDDTSGILTATFTQDPEKVAHCQMQIVRN